MDDRAPCYNPVDEKETEMSIEFCTKCAAFIDTDIDAEAYGGDGKHEPQCERCREREAIQNEEPLPGRERIIASGKTGP
jgi:hypothetical protein